MEPWRKSDFEVIFPTVIKPKKRIVMKETLIISQMFNKILIILTFFVLIKRKRPCRRKLQYY